MDLAPKRIYTNYLTVLVIGLILTSALHQYSLKEATHANYLLPFIITTIIWALMLIALLFLLNKCRYIVLSPMDDEFFVIGNLFREANQRKDKIKLSKKLFGNLFKVDIDGRSIYILSSDRLINDFEKGVG